MKMLATKESRMMAHEDHLAYEVQERTGQRWLRIVLIVLASSSVFLFGCMVRPWPDVLVITAGSPGGTIRDGMLGVNGNRQLLDGTGACPEATAMDFITAFQIAGITYIRTHDMNGPMDMSVLWEPSVDPTMPHDFNWDGSRWGTTYDCAGGSSSYTAHHNSNEEFINIYSAGFIPYLRIGDSAKYAPYEKETLDLTDPTSRTQYAIAATTVVKHFYNNIVGTFPDNYTPYTATGYVEIWNEPNNGDFWDIKKGDVYTYTDFFPVYCEVASRIKVVFPDLKVGGSGVSPVAYLNSSDTYAEEFIRYVAGNCENSMDFFSFHMYSDDPVDFTNAANHYRELLRNYLPGGDTTELHLTEYNSEQENWGTDTAGRDMTAAWIELQNQQEVVVAHFYRGAYRGIYSTGEIVDGLFYDDGSGTAQATPAGNAFSLWNEMTTYETLINTSIVPLSYTGSTDIHVLAGQIPATRNYGFLIVNRDTALDGWYIFNIGTCGAANVTIDELDSTGTTLTSSTLTFPGTYTISAGAIQLIQISC